MTDATENVYAWWESALKGLPPAVRQGIAEPGYYRQIIRHTNTGEIKSRAIAIWFDEEVGVLTARIDNGDDLTDEADVWQAFIWGHQKPVSYETYNSVVFDGQPWPDEIAIQPLAGVRAAHEECALQIKNMKDQFERWLEGAGGKIDNEESASIATSYADRFHTLEKSYESERETRKKPHLDAGNLVDKQWNPSKKAAAAAKDRAKQIQGPFLQAKQDAINAEIRRQRHLQDEARESAMAGEQPILPEPRNETRAKSGGDVARSVSLRDVDVFTVTDIQSAAEFISKRNQVPDKFIEAILWVAKELHRDGIAVPGIEVTTEKKVA